MSAQRPTYSASVSGDLTSAETRRVLEEIHRHLGSAMEAHEDLQFPVNVLLALDTSHVYLAVSVVNVAPTEGRLVIEDFRNIRLLTEEWVREISTSKYGFSCPYILSFDAEILVAPSRVLSIYRPVRPNLSKTKCFVIMPFAQEMELVYAEVCKIFADLRRSGVELRCTRGDQSLRPEVITEHIWQEINDARFLIADLSGQNANVYYELGLAHALAKPVILITQDTAVPFDVQAIRYIRYSIIDADARERFRSKLTDTIREVMELLDSLGQR